MKDRVISWHSGYKGEEYPLSFFFEKKEVSVRQLISTKLIENSKTGKRDREFIVKTESGEIYEITVSEQTTVTRIRVKKA